MAKSKSAKRKKSPGSTRAQRDRARISAKAQRRGVATRPLAEAPPEVEQEQLDDAQGPAFLIVGIGASAGGLEASTQFLKAMPAQTGMAFILVQHLSPTHQSVLPELLTELTSMPVV